MFYLLSIIKQEKKDYKMRKMKMIFVFSNVEKFPKHSLI